MLFPLWWPWVSRCDHDELREDHKELRKKYDETLEGQGRLRNELAKVRSERYQLLKELAAHRDNIPDLLESLRLAWNERPAFETASISCRVTFSRAQLMVLQHPKVHRQWVVDQIMSQIDRHLRSVVVLETDGRPLGTLEELLG